MLDSNGNTEHLAAIYLTIDSRRKIEEWMRPLM